MKKKLSYFKRLRNSYRLWKSLRNQKVLDKMVAYSMDAAIRLCNKKRDISNHKCWVVSGSAMHLVFLRYQRVGLQSQGLLKPNLDAVELDRLASYTALPYTEKDHRRGGILRKFVGGK